MDIELGIQNVARTVTFSTEQSADEVNAAIADAVENGKTINLTDDKGRRIVVPARSATPSSVPKPSTPSVSATSDPFASPDFSFELKHTFSTSQEKLDVRAWLFHFGRSTRFWFHISITRR